MNFIQCDFKMNRCWPLFLIFVSGSLLAQVGADLPVKIDKKYPRQAHFFKHLMPAVEKSNQLVLNQRKNVLSLSSRWQKNHSLTVQEQQKLKSLAHAYQVPMSSNLQQVFSQLKKRVDVVPASMALAQAANESAWGKSRFARLGKNYFGQWCYQPGCGIVPKARAKNAHYEVKRFSSVESSIASYIHNLNTNASYQSFRNLRAQSRLKSQQLNGYDLAQGLVQYSTLRYTYVKMIQNLIKHYDLQQLDNHKQFA